MPHNSFATTLKDLAERIPVHQSRGYIHGKPSQSNSLFQLDVLFFQFRHEAVAVFLEHLNFLWGRGVRRRVFPDRRWKVYIIYLIGSEGNGEALEATVICRAG